MTLGRLADSPQDKATTALPINPDSGQSLTGADASLLLAGAVVPAEYILGPGDLLAFERGFSAGPPQALAVDAEGFVYLPDLGRRRAAGASLETFRRGLLAELRPFLPRAKLDLRLIRPRAFKVFLVGETSNPGTVIATAANRAVEAITQRGGITRRASLRNIELHRASGAIERVDLQSFLNLGDLEHDPWLADGDRIVIPAMRDQIYLVGPVFHTEFFELAPGDTLGGVLRLAGGLQPDAREDSILISRFVSPTHAESIWVSTRNDSRLPLQPDDRIFVRRKSPWHPLEVVYTSGEVREPGAYPIREGQDKLSDLLRWTGGFTQEASLSNIVLLREPDPRVVTSPDLDRLRRLTRAEMTEGEFHDLKARTEGQRTTFELDLSKGLLAGSQQDIYLRTGDRLVAGSMAHVIRVGGEVVRPGLIGFRENLEPRAYVDLAGGFGPRADRGDLRVIRTGDGTSVAAKDVRRLSPGDYVWVPERPSRSPFWSVFKDVITVTAQVATIILVITSNRTTN